MAKMMKLIDGFLIGFGSALSIIVSAASVFLSRVLESGYLIVEEAKVIKAAQIATNAGILLGLLLVAAGLGIELSRRCKMDKCASA